MDAFFSAPIIAPCQIEAWAERIIKDQRFTGETNQPAKCEQLGAKPALVRQSSSFRGDTQHSLGLLAKDSLLLR